MTNFEHLRIEEHDSILRVCIDRPEKRNPLGRAVLAEIGRLFSERATDTQLRAAVITGAGDKSFAAGGDLKEFSAIRSEEDVDALFRQANEALAAVRRFPVPVIAALNGTALGGGAELAVACDFRVAARHASIGFVQGRLNISTGFGGGTDLVELLGAHRALSVLVRSEVFDAVQAQRIGLFDEVAGESESLEDCLQRFLQPMRAQAPQVLRAFKAQALAARLALPRSEREREERSAFVRTWTHPDHWAAAEKVMNRIARGKE